MREPLANSAEMRSFRRPIPLRLCRKLVWVYCAGTVFLSACSAAAGITGGFSGGSSATSIPDSETDPAIGLFGDGPVDIPVTIAKLEAPDVDKITISIEPIVPQLVRGRPEFAGDAGYLMTITGQAVAVNFAETPFILAFPLDESNQAVVGAEVVAAVNADGSFALSLAIPEIDTPVAFVAADATQTVSSPPLVAVENVIITTNSGSLDEDQALVGQNKKYLLSVSDADGTTELISMSKDGSAPEPILESEAPLELLALEEGKVTYVDDQGGMGLVIPEIGLNTPIIDLEHYDAETTNLMMSASGAIVEQHGEDVSIDFYDVLNDANVAVIPTDEGYLDLRTSLSAQDQTLYVISSDTPGEFILSKVDVSDVTESSWGGRDQVRVIEAETLGGLDVSDSGVAVFAAGQNGSTYVYAMDCPEGCLVHVNDPAVDGNAYANPQVNADANVILVCQISSDPAAGNQLYYHLLGRDAEGTLTPLTRHADYEVCTADPGSYYIDEENKVHFYRRRLDGSEPSQHAIVDLGTLVE